MERHSITAVILKTSFMDMQGRKKERKKEERKIEITGQKYNFVCPIT